MQPGTHKISDRSHIFISNCELLYHNVQIKFKLIYLNYGKFHILGVQNHTVKNNRNFTDPVMGNCDK